MELKTCPNGHTYDPSISSSCPICGSGSETMPTVGMNTPADNGHTIPLTYNAGGTGPTVPLQQSWGTPPTEPVNGFGSNSWAPADNTYGGSSQPGYTPTQAVGLNKEGVYAKSLPLTGWLVCIEGVEKGKDYRIHEEYNYIGRSPKMDVCIAGDGAVSWERHAVIAYDREERMFYFAPSGGGSIVRQNGKPVMNNVLLKSGDRLKIGNSTFLFVPFCGENFQWEE